MNYTYDTHKRFNGRKPYACTFMDTLYRSDSVTREGGRKFKRFYENLARHIFDINLEICEQVGDYLPITYNERRNAAAVAMALSRLTPYAISEYSLDCRGVEFGEGEYQSRRAIDFWCSTEDRRLEIWIESKHLWLNVGKKARRAFDKSCKSRISSALKQLQDIKQLIHAGRTSEGLKCALFSVQAYCERGQCVENLSELDSLPQEVGTMLYKESDRVLNARGEALQFGVLVSALDLRPSIGHKAQDVYHYPNGYTPFVLLVAVVMM